MNAHHLARNWIETLWNQRKPSALPDLMDPAVTGVTEGAPIHGPDQFRQFLYEPMVAAFPDLHIDIDGIIAEGDQAVIRWTMVATHTGPLLDIAPSGRRVRFSGTTWLRFRHGKIIEGSDSFNLHGLLAYLSGGPATARVMAA